MNTHSSQASSLRVRAVVAAALLSIATAVATISFSPATASAVGTRSTQEKISCSLGGRKNAPTAVAGTAYTCTINVGDTGTGATIRPTGTATLTTSSASVAQTNGSCTLAPVATNNWDTTCTAYLVVVAPGSVTIGADYSGDATFAAASAVANDQIAGVTVSAGANLSVLATLPGTSGNNTGQITTGQSFTVYASNCTGTGATTGYVLAGRTDPTTTPEVIMGPFTVTGGAYSYPVTLTAADAGTYFARYVCASGPVTSASDPDILLTSSLYSSTITAGAALRSTTPADSGTVAQSFRLAAAEDATVPSVGTATFSHNVDDLNAVDRMAIYKAGSDALKVRTDQLVAASGAVSRAGYMLVDGGLDRAATEWWTARIRTGSATTATMAAELLAGRTTSAYTRGTDAEFVAGIYLRGRGRAATDAELSAAVGSLQRSTATRAQLAATVANSPEAVSHWADRTYAVAAYQATTATMPTEAQLNTAVTRLGSGTLKVNVVEDIALGAASAAAWNVDAPAGRTPAAARFTSPVAAAPPAARTAPSPRRTTARKPAKRRAAARTAASRKVATRKVVSRRTATVRKAASTPATTRKVVARRTATVRR